MLLFDAYTQPCPKEKWFTLRLYYMKKTRRKFKSNNDKIFYRKEIRTTRLNSLINKFKRLIRHPSLTYGWTTREWIHYISYHEKCNKALLITFNNLWIHRNLPLYCTEKRTFYRCLLSFKRRQSCSHNSNEHR